MVRLSICALAALVVSAAALVPAPREELYTLELAPGVTKVVTEEGKWELKRQGVKFMDVTEYGPTDFSASAVEPAAVTYPTAVAQTAAVKALLPSLSAANLKSTLTTFSAFYNRYYKSTYGAQSSAWIVTQVQAIIDASNATAAVKVAPFAHSWTQSSVIATIPGQSASAVVASAHQDSINQANPSSGKAPGADDDGTASMQLLEVLRVLLTDGRVGSGQAVNTIEFHWYAAEEGGLLGSQAVWKSYKAAGRVVKALLHQDMTGYVAPGSTESIGVFTDYVSTPLTTFVRRCIKAYSTLPVVLSTCGYACSDHASATNAGYPSALVSESGFDEMSPYIHSAQDTLSTVNFSHFLELTKVTLAIVYELAFATL